MGGLKSIRRSLHRRSSSAPQSSLPPIEPAVSVFAPEPEEPSPAPWSSEGVQAALQQLANLGYDVSAAYEAVLGEIAARWVWPRLELRDATVALTAAIASLLGHLDRIVVRTKGLVQTLVAMGAQYGVVHSSEFGFALELMRGEVGLVEVIETTRRELAIVRRAWVAALPLVRGAAVGAGSSLIEAITPHQVVLDVIGSSLEQMSAIVSTQLDLWTRHLAVSWARLDGERLLEVADAWAPLAAIKTVQLGDAIRALQQRPPLAVPPYEPKQREWIGSTL